MRRAPGSMLGLLVAIALTAGLGAQVLGWRAVVMRSDSMGDRAPSGSLIIAGPGRGSDVEVGDLLVMRHSDSPTVTHEAIEIHERDRVRVATTKGARNSQADGTPYQLDGDVLTVRLAIPFGGRVVAGFRAYWMALVLFMGAALVMTSRPVETSRIVERKQPLPVSRAVPGI